MYFQISNYLTLTVIYWDQIFLSYLGGIVDLTNQLLCVPAARELDCRLVVIPVCGLVTPVEKPVACDLDKVVEKHARQKVLQALSLKHGNVCAKHKHDLWTYGSYHFRGWWRRACTKTAPLPG